jgi:predicted dehydrogenase
VGLESVMTQHHVSDNLLIALQTNLESFQAKQQQKLPGNTRRQRAAIGIRHQHLVTVIMAEASSSSSDKAADAVKIAVLGAGWWSQGWHLPQLHRNPSVDLVGIVDPHPHPQSNLNPNLESLDALSHKYRTRLFASFDELLKDPTVGPTLQGVIVCTPHATHSALGLQILEENKRRLSSGQQSPHISKLPPIHVLMEKPFTTRIDHAKALHEMVSQDMFRETVFFSINHSANYRSQTKKARDLVQAGVLGDLRFCQIFFASPLCSIFEDPAHRGWNEPAEGMLGNGFAWGQASHVLAWLFHVVPNLRPQTVYCQMTHSPTTGADVAHAASITCQDSTERTIVISLSGTSLLPGDAHFSDPPVGKHIDFGLYGSAGTLLYRGMDLETASGSLELRKAPLGDTKHPAGPGFFFENFETEGHGPESMQALVHACQARGAATAYVGASSLVGLRTVQVLDAMYRSHAEQQVVKVTYAEEF